MDGQGGAGGAKQQGSGANFHGSDILDATTHKLQLEKSNILLLGPTGSGMCHYEQDLSHTVIPVLYIKDPLKMYF